MSKAVLHMLVTVARHLKHAGFSSIAVFKRRRKREETNDDVFVVLLIKILTNHRISSRTTC